MSACNGCRLARSSVEGHGRSEVALDRGVELVRVQGSEGRGGEGGAVHARHHDDVAGAGVVEVGDGADGDEGRGHLATP